MGNDPISSRSRAAAKRSSSLLPPTPTERDIVSAIRPRVVIERKREEKRREEPRREEQIRADKRREEKRREIRKKSLSRDKYVASVTTESR